MELENKDKYKLKNVSDAKKESSFSFMELYATFVAAFSFLCIGLLRAYTSPAIASMKNDPDIFNTTTISEKEVISWTASSPPLASFIGTVISGNFQNKNPYEVNTFMSTMLLSFRTFSPILWASEDNLSPHFAPNYWLGSYRVRPKCVDAIVG